jgi:hypothetical protein
LRMFGITASTSVRIGTGVAAWDCQSRARPGRTRCNLPNRQQRVRAPLNSARPTPP